MQALAITPDVRPDHAEPATADLGHPEAPSLPAMPADTPPDLMRAIATLLESRLRWHDLALLAADLAFETDHTGRFTFVAPATALGWDATRLIGTASASLLVDPTADPFSTNAAVRGLRTWLRRGDGSVACVLMAAAPVIGPSGQRTGARGLAVDTSDAARQEDATLASLRRLEALEHILGHTREEILAPRMMQAALTTLRGALGAEGAAVVGIGGPQTLLHTVGTGADAIVSTARRLLYAADSEVATQVTPDGQVMMIAGTFTRFGEVAGLAVWRAPGGRPWDEDEQRLLHSASAIVRVVLEHGAIQREMTNQARTDPLTGLFNRRAFLEELPRRLERLERDAVTGALLYIDLDRLKDLNDRWGHETGDAAIRLAAQRLRDMTRPTDLIARLGGDEFVVWLDGADMFAAAERADLLCRDAGRPNIETPEGPVVLSFSVGVAARPPGAFEDLDGLIHRADEAMYVAKASGRGRWHAAELPE